MINLNTCGTVHLIMKVYILFCFRSPLDVGSRRFCGGLEGAVAIKKKMDNVSRKQSCTLPTDAYSFTTVTNVGMRKLGF